MANLSICLEECCDSKSFHSLPNVYLRQSFLEYPSPFIYKLTIKLTEPEDCLHHTEIQSNDCYIFDDRFSNVKQFISLSREETDKNKMEWFVFPRLIPFDKLTILVTFHKHVFNNDTNLTVKTKQTISSTVFCNTRPSQELPIYETQKDDPIERRQSTESFGSSDTLSSSDISEFRRSYSNDSIDTDLSSYTTSEGSVSPRTLGKCKNGEIPRPVLRRSQARNFSQEDLEECVLTSECPLQLLI